VSICYIYKETATLVEISCTVGSSLQKSVVNLKLTETTLLHWLRGTGIHWKPRYTYSFL